MTSEDTSAEAVAGPVELPSDSAHLGTDLQYKLRHQLNSASGWLFAIAGVTGINALLYVSQSDIRMLFGLISTQLLMVILGSGGPVGQTVALVGTFAIAAVFALFGVLTRKGTMWALWAGTIVYALDLLVLLGILGTRDVLGPALHAVAMVILGKAAGLCVSSKPAATCAFLPSTVLIPRRSSPGEVLAEPRSSLWGCRPS